MLQFNPNHRININQVIESSFFKGYEKINAQITYPVDNIVIYDQEINFGKNKLHEHKQTVLKSQILKVYIMLIKRSREYYKYLKTNSKDDYISWLYSCLWLANISIVNNSYFTIPQEYIKIIKTKMVPGICEYLRFYILPLYQ